MDIRKKVFISYLIFISVIALLLYPILFSLSGKIVETVDKELLASTFTHTFFLISLFLLLAFGIFALIVVHYVTAPLKKIIQEIKNRETTAFFEIPLEKGLKSRDEFGILAATLNSLSKRIQNEISSLVQEKNEKAAILESLVEGVIAVDNNNNITYVNRAALNFLSLQKEDLIDENFEKLGQKKLSQLIEQAKKKKTAVTETLQIGKKPKKYLDTIAVPKNENGTIVVLQDKSSLHKVIERGRDFIANSSHELKTPITIIRGFAETLHDHPELTKEISQEITKKIVSNCHRMDTLVRNLLTLAALDEDLPSSRLHDCDLVDIVERAKLTILNVHPNAKISIIEKGERPYLRADNDLLFQAILNLLDNAAKYSKPKEIEITVAVEKKDHEVVLEISDKGIGIPPDELERIFERFYAVDKSHSRSLGGSGLGLSIVESIVEKHKGKIDVHSQVGLGTKFTLVFPD